MNPYYCSVELNLEMIEFNEPNLCYEFNTLVFWATPEGQVYSASDSGCSCPTPFENYDFPTREEVLQSLERIGSVEHAEQIFNNWSKGYEGRSFLPISKRFDLSNWIKTHLKT